MSVVSSVLSTRSSAWKINARVASLMDSIFAIGFGLGLRLVVDAVSHHDFKLTGTLVGLWEGIILLHFLKKMPKSTDPYVAYGVRLFVDFLCTESVARLVLVLIWTGLGMVLADITPALWDDVGLNRIWRRFRRDIYTISQMIPTVAFFPPPRTVRFSPTREHSIIPDEPSVLDSQPPSVVTATTEQTNTTPNTIPATTTISTAPAATEILRRRVPGYFPGDSDTDTDHGSIRAGPSTGRTSRRLSVYPQPLDYDDSVTDLSSNNDLDEGNLSSGASSVSTERAGPSMITFDSTIIPDMEVEEEELLVNTVDTTAEAEAEVPVKDEEHTPRQVPMYLPPTPSDSAPRWRPHHLDREALPTRPFSLPQIPDFLDEPTAEELEKIQPTEEKPPTPPAKDDLPSRYAMPIPPVPTMPPPQPVRSALPDEEWEILKSEFIAPVPAPATTTTTTTNDQRQSLPPSYRENEEFDDIYGDEYVQPTAEDYDDNTQAADLGAHTADLIDTSIVSPLGAPFTFKFGEGTGADPWTRSAVATADLAEAKRQEEEERERKIKEAEAARKKEEEERADAAKRAEEEAERQRVAAEEAEKARLKEEAEEVERQRVAAEEAELARLKEEEEKRKREEEKAERKKKEAADELARKQRRAEDEAAEKKRKEEEAARKEEEKRLKAEEKAEEKRKKDEKAEAKKRREEERAAKVAEKAEADRLALELKKQEEIVQRRKDAEEAEARRKQAHKEKEEKEERERLEKEAAAAAKEEEEKKKREEEQKRAEEALAKAKAEAEAEEAAAAAAALSVALGQEHQDQQNANEDATKVAETQPGGAAMPETTPTTGGEEPASSPDAPQDPERTPNAAQKALPPTPESTGVVPPQPVVTTSPEDEGNDDEQLDESGEAEVEIAESVITEASEAPSSVGKRLQKLILGKAQMVEVQDRIEELMEGLEDPEQDHAAIAEQVKEGEKILTKMRRKERRRYEAGLATHKLPDPSNLDDSSNSISFGETTPAAAANKVMEKLEELMRPGVKTLDVTFIPASGKKSHGPKQKQKLLEVLQDYNLFEHAQQDGRTAHVVLLEQEFKDWLGEYRAKVTQVPEDDDLYSS